MLKDIGMDGVMEPMAYPIRGARFAGPSGREANLGGERTGAWIVGRARFDAALAQAAEQAGARFEQQFKVIRALRDPDGRYRGVSDGTREIEADLVLFADGAHSRFSGGQPTEAADRHHHGLVTRRGTRAQSAGDVVLPARATLVWLAVSRRRRAGQFGAQGNDRASKGFSVPARSQPNAC